MYIFVVSTPIWLLEVAGSEFDVLACVKPCPEIVVISLNFMLLAMVWLLWPSHPRCEVVHPHVSHRIGILRMVLVLFYWHFCTASLLLYLPSSSPWLLFCLPYLLDYFALVKAFNANTINFYQYLKRQIIFSYQPSHMHNTRHRINTPFFNHSK